MVLVAVGAYYFKAAVARQLAPREFREVRAVPRLRADSPGAIQEFFSTYRGKQPVVIEGALTSWAAMNWTAPSLATKCPEAHLPVYEYDLRARDWAALREVDNIPLKDYFGKEFGCGGSCPRRQRYALEMSMRNECPQLLEDVRIPPFFMDDLLVRYYKKGAWPTLIAGPRGTRSGLHRDTHDLPFWMALFAGRKRWRIFLPDEKALEPHFLQERNGFAFDPFEPDFARHPGLAEASVYEHFLEAGQLLYIPNGAPHAAFNLEDAIAISGNYLDPQSLKHHTEVTCNTSLWRDSKLCWAYSADFAGHKALPLEKLRELTYFQFAGFDGPKSWCKDRLFILRHQKQKLKYLPIVEEYCAAQGEE